MKRYNRLIDVVISAYNVPDEILFRCLASIACQDIVKDIEVTIVDDASTEENYAENNFKWCKRYYDEVYKDLEGDISKEILSQQYNDIMRNAYMGDKLNGIIPHVGIFEFLDSLK